MRTRLSICRKKARYPTDAEALEIAQRAAYPYTPIAATDATSST